MRYTVVDLISGEELAGTNTITLAAIVARRLRHDGRRVFVRFNDYDKPSTPDPS